jgi:glycosyltransferase involved in cell wall biosynthesis
MKPLVTALIDTYNHERYIEQALVSVLDQGLSPAELEIVVVDDGSTDETPAIIQKFVPRVKHVRKKNGGQASAFNMGFAASRGEIVAILDGDDWWAKRKLAVVLEALEKNPEVAAVGHGYHEFHEQTKQTRVYAPPGRAVLNTETPEAIRAALRLWPFLLMGALTVRRKVLEWIMPIPEEMVFMADTAIQAAAAIMGTLVLEEPLFYYRRHAQNLYAIDPKDAARLRRKYNIAELAYEGVYRRLIELGVREECVSMLFTESWVQVKRERLSRFGGGRLQTFRTEMQAFHAAFRNPSVGYQLFKYLVVGAGTMILPPRQFYGIRQWYAKRHLGRYRDWVFRQDVTDWHD